MSVQLNPWMRCDCKKIHLRSGISPNSLCTCGRRLWERAWERA